MAKRIQRWGMGTAVYLGGVDPGELDAAAANAVAASPAIARVDPGASGSAGRPLAWNPQTGVPFWQKRRYILVDDYTDAGGTVQDALNAVPSTGADVVFRADGSAYTVPNAGLTVKSNTRIVPMGSRAAKLTAPAGATGSAVISSNGASGVRIEGLEIDCNSDATMTRGVALTHNSNIYRDIIVNDVTVRNAASRAFWFWKAGGIHLRNVRAYDSTIGIYIDDVSGMVRVTDPHIVNTVAGRMTNGIIVQAGGARETEGVEIRGAWIAGADYASANGSSAHGITVSRCQGVRVIGGEISGCGNPANSQGGGIFYGSDSYHGAIIGTNIHDNHAAGVWSEIIPAGDVTLGTDTAARGMTLTNVTSERNGFGFSGSYGAGTVYTSCQAIENRGGGFVTDAEGTTYIGCRAVNNFVPEASRPAQNGGVRAGFRAYMGPSGRNEMTGSYIGCHSYDNRTTPIQEYGFTAEDKGYRFVGNNGSGSLGAWIGGTTNNKFSANNW